jgi:hypothetical protein
MAGSSSELIDTDWQALTAMMMEGLQAVGVSQLDPNDSTVLSQWRHITTMYNKMANKTITRIKKKAFKKPTRTEADMTASGLAELIQESVKASIARVEHDTASISLSSITQEMLYDQDTEKVFTKFWDLESFEGQFVWS